MKVACTISQRTNGTWLVRHAGSWLGAVEIVADTREEALSKMRDELQYRSELCPCSGASGDIVELEPIEEGTVMNDPFEKKVRAAAIAGWWVVLVAVIFLTLIWLIYLAVMATRPAWLLMMWGPGVEWPFVQEVWFWAVACFKFCLWFVTLGVLWLTLWARQLRKLDQSATT